MDYEPHLAGVFGGGQGREMQRALQLRTPHTATQKSIENYALLFARTPAQLKYFPRSITNRKESLHFAGLEAH